MVLSKMSKIKLVLDKEKKKNVISKSKDNDKNIFIEGMPGVGNIGKQTIDYLAKKNDVIKIAEIYSSYFPHIVKIKNEITLPHHNLYYFENDNIGYFLYTGDAQSKTDEGTYEFAKFILDLISDFNIEEIITIGGVGLKSYVEDPKIYLIGDDDLKERYSTDSTSSETKGKVNMILGLSGIILGHVDLLRKSNKDINYNYLSVLIETMSSPLYPSYKESKLMIKFFDEHFNLDIDYSDIDKKIETFNKSKKVSNDLKQLDRLNKSDDDSGSYIG